MLKFIYYFLWLIVSVGSLFRIYDTKNIITSWIENKERIKLNEDLGGLNSDEDIIHYLFKLGVFLSLIGLFSYNWVLFALLIFFSLLLDFIFKIIFKVKYLTTYYRGYQPSLGLIISNTVYGIIFFFVGIFSILNSYHLHIDLFNVLKSLF